MKLSLPQDPARRAFVVAVICSVLFHVLLVGSMFWFKGFGVPAAAKRGETLFVDISPDKPEEKAPLGNPARPPGPPAEPVQKAPELPAPAPKVAAPRPAPPRPAASRPPAPRPEAPRPAPPAPEPPRQIAKAPPPPPAPEPVAKAPAPLPEPPPPAPTPRPPAPAAAPREPTPQSPSAHAPPGLPAPRQDAVAPPAAPSTGSPAAGSQTALATPRAPSIFRNPGGGGGLQGGHGGTAGEPIPLDTPDPNYREYMDKVKQRIYAKWGYPYEAQSRGLQGKLIVEFHIAKDGQLQFIELRNSSGEEILDSFAMTAVKLAQIYPPLPDAMKRDVLPVVAVFVYTLRGPLSVLQSLQ